MAKRFFASNLYLSSELQAKLYKKFRPSPPKELVNRIIQFVKEQRHNNLDTALDIGCGSGQSTKALAPFFNHVFGIDNSPEQINQAALSNNLKNINYSVGNAVEMRFPNESIDLVTAGQCAHFFNMEKFYAEVDRVMRPGGVLAIYGYCLPQPIYGEISLEPIVKHLFLDTIRSYVSDESILVYIKNYNTEEFKKFSFSKDPVLREWYSLNISDASLLDLLGYVESWSGFQRLIKNCGNSKASEVLDQFKNEVLERINKHNFEPEHVKLSIIFKYFLILGCKT